MLLPYNNQAAVERIVEREAANLAAVIVDPLPNNAGFPDPAPGFLPFLRAHGYRATVRDTLVAYLDADLLAWLQALPAALKGVDSEAAGRLNCTRTSCWTRDVPHADSS